MLSGIIISYLKLKKFSMFLAFMVLTLLWASVSSAQLNENCVVSVLNRTAQVQADGNWAIPDVPSTMGLVRVRATCVENGLTRSGQSDWVAVPTGESLKVGDIPLDVFEPAPESLETSASETTLTYIGETSQLYVVAYYPEGITKVITPSSMGTVYGTTNPAIATVSAEGLVTATGTGKVIITASNEMVLSSVLFSVTQGILPDSDGDGLPDEWELANGLNPNDPIDALKDPDSDGLTNIEEYNYGTDFLIADTDGDGIDDGEEVIAGDDGYVTNPLLADTDGDGINDGLEVLTSSDPTSFASINLAQALSSILVTPSVNDITFNTVDGEASKQLTVTGNLIDGSTIDLTSTTRGTNYNSSNFAIAGFGATPGLVFAGNSGTATITATNNGFSDTALVTVQTFSPTALSSIALPAGASANNVDVDGDYLYVAGGTGGMFVVDVADRSVPFIAATLDTPGSANDIKISGNLALVADGASGLQIIDITDPLAPVTTGAMATTDAQDVVFDGTIAYVADGSAGFKIIDFTNPANPVLVGSIDTPDIALGVDVDPINNIAVVADLSSTQVIDIADPSLPQIVGFLGTSYQARDLIVKDGMVYLADFPQGGLKAIDISVPSVPSVVGMETLGGYLLDVAAFGNLLFGADMFRVNAVPIYNISIPGSPIFTSLLDFSSYGDDNGSGIDIDNEYIYLATDRERVLIGQYRLIRDNGIVPPVVDITSPQDGATAIEGSTITITVDATDDVEVAAVDIFIRGMALCTDTSVPYSCDYTVPVGNTSFDIGAQAVDLAGNIGIAPGLMVNIVPDPLTTVTGFVVDEFGTPVGGVTVTTIDGLFATTLADGSFSIPDVPTINGALSVTASTTIGGVVYGGRSISVFPVASGNTDVGTIEIGLVPIISSFTPQGGVIGTSVTITGESFDAAVPANNQVFFSNNVPATVLSATATTITTTVPAGTTTGKITVTNLYGTSVSTDDFEVTITINTDTIIASNNFSYDGMALTVDGAVVSINGSHSFSSLNVINGALVTHAANTTTSAGTSLTLDISGVLTVDATSSIDVSGKGYLGARSGGNSGSAGRTLGNTTTGGSDANAGGSYGGRGGRYSQSNTVYGSFYDPNEVGSGGASDTGYYSGYTGGDGGGLVRITAGEIVLDGAIKSDGLGSPSGHSGGGSGGGINIQVGIISGTGSITAHGGTAPVELGGTCGGGGGRIAVYYNDISGFDTNLITTYGGVGNYNSAPNGGAGTLYLENLVTGVKTLSADNKGITAKTTPLLSPDGMGFTFDTFTISNAADLSIDHMTVNTSLTLDNASLKATGGVNAAEIIVQNNSTLNTKAGMAVTNITALNNSTLSISAGMTATNVTVQTGSTITHSDATLSRTYNLTMDISGVLNIDSASSIDVTGKGYLGARSGGNDGDYGRTLDNTTTGGSYANAGGSYGGRGGRYNQSNTVYGSFYDPNELGSGGSSDTGYYGGSTGGDGGGLVRITAGEINLDGAIRSDGLGTPSGHGGGGSGGGINIQVGIISGTGSITAHGGAAPVELGGTCGGGGGRIAVYYNDISGFDTNLITTYGGIGNYNNAPNGGAGTLYLENLVTGAKTLSADNKGITAKTTPLLSPDGLGFTFDTFTISNATDLSIDHMMVNTLLTLDNASLKATSGVSAAEIIVQNNSIFNIIAGMTAMNVTVQTGSTITHSDATLGSTYSLSMDVMGILSIDSTSSIDVTGKGYLGARSGTGNNGNTGYTLGNTTTGGSTNISGGSYGGLGGRSNTANAVYGNIFDPNELGSGGGCECSVVHSPAGDGGGLARITVGEIVLNGAIRADGGTALYSGVGGGSGGGLKIDVGVLSGTGSITANGGNGYSMYSGSGGGGGRIALYYNNISGFDTNMITTHGGTGVSYNGSAGTLYLEDLVTGAQSMSVDNGGSASVTTSLVSSDGSGFTFDSLTISNMNLNIDHLTVTTGLTLDNSTLNATAGITAGDITLQNNSALNDSVGITTGDITLQNNSSLNATAAITAANVTVQNTSTLNISAGMTATNVSALTGSLITHKDATTTDTYSLVMDISGILTVDATSLIDVSGKGYLGGASGDNNSLLGRTLGNTTSGASFSYSAASYGGLGGQPDADNGINPINNVYGSFYNPNELGSGGGGNGGGGEYPGGDGGGLVRITAGEIILDGAIKSDGIGSLYGASGGGSGGGIKIQTGILSGTGAITAHGGTEATNLNVTSGGGGGRIAVYYNDISGFDTNMITTHGGLGDYSGTANGGAGTLYLESSAQTYGDLIVDNNNIATTAYSTPLPSVGTGTSTGLTADTLTDSSKVWGAGALYGIYLNPNTAQVTIPPDLFFISANDQTTITVLNTPYNLTDIATIGDTYIGEHHFDNLYVINGASVETLDDVYYNALVITGGTLQAANTYQVGKNVLKKKSMFAKLFRFFKGVVTLEAKARDEVDREKVTTGYSLQEDEVISSSQEIETLKEVGITAEISSRKDIKSDINGQIGYN